jgi:hypothetical protein
VKRKVKGAEEWDVITRWRRYLSWRPGEVSAIKRRMRRRERRDARSDLRREQS